MLGWGRLASLLLATFIFLPSPSSAATPDFNGDGKGDILWRHTSGLVSAWLMNGASVSSSGSPISVGIDWTIQGAGDFNGDGKTDILWRHTSGPLSIWFMNDSSVSGSGSPGNVGTDWEIQATGDFNGDGRTDIAVGTRQGQVFVFSTPGLLSGNDWPNLRGDPANTGVFAP